MPKTLALCSEESSAQAVALAAALTAHYGRVFTTGPSRLCRDRIEVRYNPEEVLENEIQEMLGFAFGFRACADAMRQAIREMAREEVQREI